MLFMPYVSISANMRIEEILWDIVSGRDDITLGLDHPNKSKSFWGKTDSIFIR
jgi:ubiquitin carboxyl-terminal hydrolase 7